MALKIKILDDENKDFLQSYYGTEAPKGSLFSSGIDLVCPTDLVIPAKSLGQKIKFGIACQKDQSREVIPHGYYLYPRSSISKTPLRMANCVGIIDFDYTGELMAKVDNHSDEEFKISKGDKLFQLCMPHLQTFTYETVNELDKTERGSGGFGSSGTIYVAEV
jgi:dUTP pyrophosphatase